MSAEVVKSYLPFPWISMAQTKHYFYKGLAHYYVAMALLEQKGQRLGWIGTSTLYSAQFYESFVLVGLSRRWMVGLID